MEICTISLKGQYIRSVKGQYTRSLKGQTVASLSEFAKYLGKILQTVCFLSKLINFSKRTV